MASGKIKIDYIVKIDKGMNFEYVSCCGLNNYDMLPVSTSFNIIAGYNMYY